MPESPSASEIREELEDVFERSEFQQRDPNRLWEYVERVFAWLGSLLDEQPVLFWLIFITCVVVLVLLLWHIIWTMRKVFVMPAEVRDAAKQERELRSALFARDAETHAATENYTEAIRCLFLSLVYRFDEAGNIRFDQAYTNHEYLNLIAQQSDTYQSLDVFVEALDVHWYGEQPTRRDEYERCRAIYDDFA